MIFTQLNCNHAGGGYFIQTPGTVFKKKRNYIAALIYHYMQHHMHYVTKEIFDEFNLAMDDEKNHATSA